ncbi:exodeoxyribonuclease III [Legionella nagasakiensis]|uniref:exodeoxyribonuclease III n=1 Tax=Legionella nagasakiensis TaxID=535290 RepID=UPI0010549EB3|nr:exodeoxyribonuclease III [Legionella nagasakiensis]
MLKLACWNVNSLKVRLEQVIVWFQNNEVDVLALQETKLINEQFPCEAFQEIGLHVVFSGQKTYNGVALISRQPIESVVTDVPGFVDPQRRILAATIAGVRVINLYVPNGGEVGSDKYQYKLNWLVKITAFIKEQLRQYPKLAVVGDFNIAPEDKDVYDPIAWQGSVLVSPLERQAFAALIDLGLKDSFRAIHPQEITYSWWDYRAAAFRRNMGLRIDHILLSDSLLEQCVDSQIDIEPRRAERPSDHAPVWVKLD